MIAIWPNLSPNCEIIWPNHKKKKLRFFNTSWNLDILRFYTPRPKTADELWPLEYSALKGIPGFIPGGLHFYGADGGIWTLDLVFTKALLLSFGFFNIYNELQRNYLKIKEMQLFNGLIYFCLF